MDAKKNDDKKNETYLSQPVFSLVCIVLAGYALYAAELSLWIIFPAGIVGMVIWFFMAAQPIVQEWKYKKMCDELIATVQVVNKTQSETANFLSGLQEVYKVNSQRYWEQINKLEGEINRYYACLEGLKGLALASAYASCTTRLNSPNTNNTEKAEKYIMDIKKRIQRLEESPKFESGVITSLLQKKISGFDRAMAKVRDRKCRPDGGGDIYAKCAICGQELVCPGCREKRREQDVRYNYNSNIVH